MIIFGLLALFLSSSWAIALLPELYPDIHHYRVFLGWLALLSLCYVLWLWRSFHLSRLKSWRAGAVAAFFATLASPVLYETDPLRYYWDGLSMVRGESPYIMAPKDHPAFAEVPWAAQLNYPYLPTIYPPGSQWIFAAATYANPFFYDKGPTDQTKVAVWSAVKSASLWQAGFGWKLIMATFAALAVVVWHQGRWDLIIAHPLFLTKFAGNVHIDGVLMVLIMAATTAWGLRPLRAGLLLGVSIATKWITALLVPFVALYYRGWREFWLCAAAAAAITCAALGYGYGTSGAMFFYSLQKFTSEWLFFGFWQRWVMDALLAANYHREAALAASKWVGYGGVIVFYSLILAGYARWVLCRQASSAKQDQLALQLALALALMTFYSGLPVINPWYLLVLLPFAIGARTLALAPLAFTLSVSASGLYYDRYEDPVLARYLAYGSVVAIMIYDLYRHRAALYWHIGQPGGTRAGS